MERRRRGHLNSVGDAVGRASSIAIRANKFGRQSQLMDRVYWKRRDGRGAPCFSLNRRELGSSGRIASSRLLGVGCGALQDLVSEIAAICYWSREA